MLSKFDHSVLGETVSGSLREAEWEDIHIIYKMIRSEFPGTRFADVVESLVRLFNMGYLECELERPVSSLKREDLLSYYGGNLTEEEINIYPKVIPHAFRATKEGREEEAKDIYDIYYPQKG